MKQGKNKKINKLLNADDRAIENLKKINFKDISVVQIKNGRLISGLKPSVDLNIHLSIYKRFNPLLVKCLILQLLL